MFRKSAVSVGVLFAALLAGGWLCPPAGRADDKSLTYPSQVLIIRHAEKPVDDPTSPELTPEGKDRAVELYKLFEQSGMRPKPFATPDFLFAGKDTMKSHRPRLTVVPLAKKLKLAVNSEYGNADMDKLVDELFHNPKYTGKVVLISWRHGAIPKLAPKLKATGSPEKWEDEVYDRVWQITYDRAGKASFVDLPQHLRLKDSEK
ncbi:hypothetical protein FRUB_07587 [Fimbriiglobus ruber]|uniref:Histidine phosphatase family protein n=2 Tax=Fimbriiglobus ruber TaxID=1908690 RepID=A0A225DQL4_9BACT|nr:hypothetical protein FRUB_07587 [Fimbriiglobus ruber]